MLDPARVSVPVFVINLERDGERRDFMQRQLANLGIVAEFIAAVDGKSLLPSELCNYDHHKALRVYGVGMIAGEFGCYLSHYRLYERIVRENISHALILEDDVDLSPHLMEIIKELVVDTDHEWCLVRLTTLRQQVENPVKDKYRGRLVQQLHHGGLYKFGEHSFGSGGYLISLQGAKLLLDYGRFIFMPIDCILDH